MYDTCFSAHFLATVFFTCDNHAKLAPSDNFSHLVIKLDSDASLKALSGDGIKPHDMDDTCNSTHFLALDFFTRENHARRLEAGAKLAPSDNFKVT